MKQNRLISIGAFILVLALSGLMTGCMEKDVYDVVTREFNGSFLKNQLLSYNPYIIVKYSQGEQNRTEVHLPKHKATAYANQSLIGSNDDAYYIDRKGAYPFAIDIPMLGFTPVTERNRIDSQYPGFATWAKSMGNDCKDWYKK